MSLQPTDIAVLRELLTHARANGWTHIVYGSIRDREHVWRRLPEKTYAARAEKVCIWNDGLEYWPAGNHMAKSVIRPETAAEAREWLRLLGLVPPTAAQVAEALVVAS